MILPMVINLMLDQGMVENTRLFEIIWFQASHEMRCLIAQIVDESTQGYFELSSSSGRSSSCSSSRVTYDERTKKNEKKR